MGFYSFRASTDYYYQRAEEVALRALDLDGSLAEAYTTLADIKMMRDLDWAGAEENFLKAIVLNPSYATAHHWYSLLLASQDRLDEALEEIRTAWSLDPRSVVINSALADIYIKRGEYDKALNEAQRTQEMDPKFMNIYYVLGASYLNKTMYEEALEAFDEHSKLINEMVFSAELLGEFIKDLLQNTDVLKQFQFVLESIGIDPKTPQEFKNELEILLGNPEALSAVVKDWKQLFGGESKGGYMHGVVYAKMGKKEKTQEILEEQLELANLQFFQLDYQIALLYFYLGDKELGFRYLNKAVDNRDPSTRDLKVDFLFDDVSSDPRFLEILQKMGLD